MSDQSDARRDHVALEKVVAERDKLREQVEAEKRRRERAIDALMSFIGRPAADFPGCIE